MPRGPYPSTPRDTPEGRERTCSRPLKKDRMISCPKGAILNRDDLATAADAAQLAAEYLESIFRAETPLPKRASTVRRERIMSLGLRARTFRKHLKAIQRVRKVKTRV